MCGVGADAHNIIALDVQNGYLCFLSIQNVFELSADNIFWIARMVIGGGTVHNNNDVVVGGGRRLNAEIRVHQTADDARRVSTHFIWMTAFVWASAITATGIIYSSELPSCPSIYIHVLWIYCKFNDIDRGMIHDSMMHDICIFISIGAFLVSERYYVHAWM